MSINLQVGRCFSIVTFASSQDRTGWILSAFCYVLMYIDVMYGWHFSHWTHRWNLTAKNGIWEYLRSGNQEIKSENENEWNQEINCWWNLECSPCFPLLPLPTLAWAADTVWLSTSFIAYKESASLCRQTEASLSQSHCQWSVKFLLSKFVLNSVQEIWRQIKDPSTAVLFPSLLHLLQSQL